MVALLVIDVQLALVVFATLPPLVVATFFFRRASVKAYELARERVVVGQRRPPGVRVRAADRAGVPARGATARQRFAERSDSYRQARVRGPVADLGLLPVRAAAVVGRRRGRADRRARAGSTRHADRPARWSPTSSTSTCSSPPSSSSPRSSTATSRPPSRWAASRNCCGSRLHDGRRRAAGGPLAARRHRLRGRALRLRCRRRTQEEALERHRPDDPRRADGRLRRRDRRGQVDPGQAGRPVLRPHRRPGHGRRHRPARPRPRPPTGTGSASSRRRRTSSRARSATPSPTAARTPPTPRWRRRPGRSARTR